MVRFTIHYDGGPNGPWWGALIVIAAVLSTIVGVTLINAWFGAR